MGPYRAPAEAQVKPTMPCRNCLRAADGAAVRAGVQHLRADGTWDGHSYRCEHCGAGWPRVQAEQFVLVTRRRADFKAQSPFLPKLDDFVGRVGKLTMQAGEVAMVTFSPTEFAMLWPDEFVLAPLDKVKLR